jgi:glutamine amidotransferase
MRVSIFDYGAGNLLVLPGVGAFGAAAERLAPGREVMREAIRSGLPVIGICLGMQLMFESSEEGAGAGLGIMAGRVERLRAIRVPHIGWNSVEPSRAASEPVSLPPTVYYANSFVCRPSDESVVSAWTTHETDRFPAIVRAGSAVGVQFHPEKSSAPGVRFLRALVSSLPTRRRTK